METVIIKDTGEIIDNVCRIYTQEQLETINRKNKKSLVRSKDNFIFITYKLLSSLNIENDNFTQPDIARIVYIMSYLSNDNRLMLTERTPMTKEKLSELMGLNKKVFNTFFNKLIKNNILIEKENYLFINKEFSFYGSIKGNKYDIIRIYKKNVRLLYNNMSSKEHKRLAILYLLIPFINIKYNIVCSNPLEEDENEVQPLTIEQLAEYFDYDLKRFISLIDFLFNLKDKDENPVIKTINNTKNKKDNSIIINPRVIYAGNDFKDVECLCVLFNKIESDKKNKK